MEKYKNLEGNSGVSEYQNGADFIRVRFKDGGQYLYTNSSAGTNNISAMQALAITGQGLNAYVNKYVKKQYASKEK